MSRNLQTITISLKKIKMNKKNFVKIPTTIRLKVQIPVKNQQIYLQAFHLSKIKKIYKLFLKIGQPVTITNRFLLTFKNTLYDFF